LDTGGITARYVKFKSLKEINGNPWTTVAEFYGQGCIPQEPSSVKEDIQALAVFPNPTSGIVTIPISGENMQSIDIVDVSGKIVRNFTIPFGMEDITIDCSGLGTGMYHIRLKHSNGALFRCSIVIQ